MFFILINKPSENNFKVEESEFLTGEVGYTCWIHFFITLKPSLFTIPRLHFIYQLQTISPSILKSHLIRHTSVPLTVKHIYFNTE